MAVITNAKLSVTRNKAAKTVKPVVTCNVQFNSAELAFLKDNPNANLFRLKCQLWGSDSGFTGKDDFLYTYPALRVFPDGSIAGVESARFEDEIGEGVLDEDYGTDEVYGLLQLVNVFTSGVVKKKTNKISANF